MLKTVIKFIRFNINKIKFIHYDNMTLKCAARANRAAENGNVISLMYWKRKVKIYVNKADEAFAKCEKIAS